MEQCVMSTHDWKTHKNIQATISSAGLKLLWILGKILEYLAVMSSMQMLDYLKILLNILQLRILLLRNTEIWMQNEMQYHKIFFQHNPNPWLGLHKSCTGLEVSQKYTKGLG